MSRITMEKAKNMSTEEFSKLVEEAEQESSEVFEDKALEQFVRKSDESDLNVGPNYKISYWAMIILFSIIGIFSFIYGILGSMEAYVAFPIVILCLIGIIISFTALKKCMNK